MTEKNLSYILEQGQTIPDKYTRYTSFTISPVGTPEEVRKTLRALRLQGTFNGRDVIFKKSGLDYETYVKE